MPMVEGVILETLSNRKLSLLTISLLIIQIIFYLIGGLIAPSPNNVLQMQAVKCIRSMEDVSKSVTKMTYSRGEGKCDDVEELDDQHAKQLDIQPEQVVFTFQIPLPRNSQELDMSRWFQNIIAMLHFEVDYTDNVTIVEYPTLTMDVRLAYRNRGESISKWTEFASSRVPRQWKCDLHNSLLEGDSVECDILPLFELGSCHHDYYLVNIQLPIDSSLNMNIGTPKNLNMMLIYANGGFSKVWFSLKTVLFPTVMLVLVWFWHRVTSLRRPSNLIERTLFTLGVVISFLNLPVEWLTLFAYMPYMQMFSDIRQSLFYVMLLCFWVVFTGEHMMDQQQRNKLSLYWKHLSIILFSSVSLLLFELCERGVQLTNPFHSIWSSKRGALLAYTFVIVACVSACVYFVFLLYMIVQALMNIYAKKSALQHFSKPRRRYYKGLIYRFNFLLLTTIFCAAMTIIYFIVGQISEGNWKWDEVTFQYNSAFLTGVYGMWNIYVSGLLILYAPSHKTKPIFSTEGDSSEDEDASTVPTNTHRLQTLVPSGSASGVGETSILMSFVNKSSID